ncbi:MAG TPA: hypothetical protein P5514_07845 [Bacteroidales bacterium]|nr:hypothetical protein [Bacteroidales bacterium]
MPNQTEILEPDRYYHIYNRAVGNELLFIDETDYALFFRKMEKFILPICDLIAYCLIPNHFHFFIRTFDDKTIQQNLKLEKNEPIEYHLKRAFSNFFNAYAKAINLKHRRMGKLFMLPYKRILVEDPDYFLKIINYIHRNPVHHGLVKQYDEWLYSSFNAYLSNKTTIVNKDLGISFFGELNEFVKYHRENQSPT